MFEDKVANERQEAEKGGMTFLTLTDRDKWVEKSRPVWAEFGKATPGAAELIELIECG